MRLIYKYLPGKSFADWWVNPKYNLSMYHLNLPFHNGYLYIIKYYVECLNTEFDEDEADIAAENGHINILIYLFHKGVKCSLKGANRAAANGHLHVIQYLRRFCGVHCTSDGANWAAMNGHLHVVKDLQKHDISCTERGSLLADRYGHKNIGDFLEECGIIYNGDSSDEDDVKIRYITLKSGECVKLRLHF